MAIKPTLAAVELATPDGTVVHDQVRVIYADRLQYEKSAKARNWNVQASPMFGAGFLAWAALTRLGLYSGTWEEFLDQVVDVTLAEPEDGEADPTRAGL